MSLWDKSLKSFRDELASSAPTPGGGAAAAVTGALGCGLFIMAAEISAARAGADPKIKDFIPRLRALMDELSSGADKDAEAYKNYMSARNEEALYAAADVPVQIIRQALSALEIAKELTPFIHSGVISDIESGESLVHGAIQAELATLESNIRWIKDPAMKEKYASVKAELLGASQKL